MRKVFLSLVVAAAIALGGNCSSTMEPVSMLSVESQLSSVRFAIGDTVRLHTVIRNVSPEPVLLPSSFPVQLEIRDSRGDVVIFGRPELRGLVLPAISRPPTRLEPGEVLTDDPAWAGELDEQEALAAPGIYSIRAVVGLVGRSGRAYSRSLAVELAAH